MPDIKLDPDRWPSPPPLPMSPVRFREALLDNEDRLTSWQVQKTITRLQYYPELQIATLKLLDEEPNHAMIKEMAEAILDIITPPGGIASDGLRIQAIDCARAALKAAAEFSDTPPKAST